MTPTVSCIVPVYNGERFLGETIESILAQDYRPLEIIVVDDGSEDSSVEVAQSFQPDVRLVQQTQAGPSAARNSGIREASGDFLAFLDQDDLWHREKITRQLTRFECQPELSVAWTHVQMFWSDDLADERERYASHPSAGVVPGYATISMLARKEVFERVELFNENLWFSDSVEWTLRARQCGIVMEMMDEVLVYHRMHERNSTRRYVAASREEFLAIAKANLDRRRQSKQS